MKVIFLDIDGVLNDEEFNETTEYVAPYPSLEWWAEGLDPKKVHLLNGLIRSTDSVVVVSSTWRLGKTVEEMQAILEIGGFDGDIVGMTPIMSDAPRGIEISTWLDHHPEVSKFVILDDDPDMAHLRHKLVQTSIDEGLTVEKVSEAQSHLCNGWENVCEAIVAEAAKGLDTHFTELQMEGCNITSDEYDLWEEAHVASYRAVNMASFGAMEIFMQAVSEWAEMCDLFDPDWEDHDWWYADEEE